MAHNSLSPGFVKLRYTENGLTHVQTIPVQPSGSLVVGEMPDLTPNVGSPVDLETFIDEYMVVFRPIFYSSTSIESAELWSMPTPTSDPIWIFTHPISLLGSSTSVAVSMGQVVMTFRTALGGIFRWYGMEQTSLFPVNISVPAASFAGVTLDLANYLKGPTSCFLARDNAKLVVPITLTTKTNDALRKKRLLL